MKKLTIKLISSLIAILLVIGYMSSCKDLLTNPLQDKETGEDITVLLLDVNFFEYKVTLEFVDNETNKLIDDQEIMVFPTGGKSQHLVSQSGEKNESYTVTSGIMELFLDPNITISQNDPLVFNINAYSNKYLSLPINVEQTEPGSKHVTVRMIDMSSANIVSNNLKSINSALTNAPFSVLINNAAKYETINSKSVANYVSVGYMYFDVYTVSGTTNEQLINYVLCNDGSLSRCNSLPVDSLHLTATNIADSTKYSNWGIFDEITKSYSKKISFTDKQQRFYSSVKLKDVEKCNEGLIIKVQGPTGSGKFEYKLTFSDGRVETGMINTFIHSNKVLKKGTKISPLWFPSNNKTVKIELSGNGQYNITNPVQDLANACGGEVVFNVTPKTGLTQFHIITKYVCDNNPNMALTLSTGNIRYKKNGTNDPWQYFSMTQGICDIWLEKDVKYDFSALIDNEWQEYIVPAYTSQTEIDNFISSVTPNNVKVTRIIVSNNQTGIVNLDIKASLKSGICK